MDLDKIRELIALAQEHDLVELEVREGEQTIRFRRNAEARSTAGSPPAGAAVGAQASPAHGIAPQLSGFVLRALVNAARRAGAVPKLISPELEARYA